MSYSFSECRALATKIIRTRMSPSRTKILPYTGKMPRQVDAMMEDIIMALIDAYNQGRKDGAESRLL